ncbi:MAG TPA: choice-of-anchor tandem repeat GloVer-containing protein [Verrucomicrobiae bacterium]|nr:choice-of-anchor tandem repeat GloVer-containing protein [Verrucomicrobiae bacterium]
MGGSVVVLTRRSSRCWLALAAGGCLLAWTISAQSFNVLYTFSGVEGAADGGNPSNLTLATNGMFYGTCVNDGFQGWGDIFQISAAGALMPMYSFTNLDPVPYDGSYPYAALTQGTNGLLYGLAQSGGSNGTGTIFKVTTNGAFTSLYAFSPLVTQRGHGTPLSTNADGAVPKYALVLDTNDGNFYGTTDQGGTNSYGTLFQLTHAGKLTVLYAFSNSVDGASPRAPLLVYTNGDLYGTTFYGGSNGSGAVFRATAAGQVTALYSFTNGIDGANPEAALIDGKDGNLYGVCSAGGSNGTGSIYKITTNGVLTPLYSFSAGSSSFSGQYNVDGINPNSLLLGSDGNFYGTAQFGTASGDGCIFEITPANAFSLLYAFTYDEDGGPNSDGAYPVSLLQYSDGKLCGTAIGGGANSAGTFFTLGLPPAITSQPTNQSIALYGNASFSLTATGSPTCQWQFDGADISNATNYTLAITNAQIADAGSYQAILTSTNGGTESSVVTLSITNVPATLPSTAGSLLYGNGQFSMVVTNLTGQGAVVIEASSDLVQWTPIYTNASGFGAAPFIDSTAGNYAVRFYRATAP